MQPGFETERLLLRPRGMADLGACLAMDRDPEVTRFIPGPWQDAAQHEAFVRSRIGTSYGDGLGYWSIFARSAPQRFAGWVLLIPENTVGPEIEIGWRLTRASWGQGYATEAARAVVHHAFRSLKLDRIIAVIDADNLSSCRIAEKIGMTVGDRRDEAGRPHLHYAMVRDDFGETAEL